MGGCFGCRGGLDERGVGGGTWGAAVLSLLFCFDVFEQAYRVVLAAFRALRFCWRSMESIVRRERAIVGNRAAMH